MKRWVRDHPVLAVAIVAKVAVTLATDARYGWHRDELYYVATARHLAFGYVDFPPVTPWLGRLELALFGPTLWAFRLLPLVAGVAFVLVVAATARRLGGGRAAESLAGLAAVAVPFFLGSNGLFQPVSFDELTWAVCLYFAVRVLGDGSRRNWLLLGVAFGAALMTKYTIVSLAAGFAIGWTLTPSARRQLRTPWPWVAIAVAGLIAAPNVAWQLANRWPTLEFLGHQNARVAAAYPPARYVGEQLLLLEPGGIWLAAPGLVWLFRSRRFRPLGWAVVTVVLWYLVLRGKGYYALTAYPVAFAAGAVWVEQRAAHWVRTAIPIALVVAAVIGLPVALPLLPVRTMIDAGIPALRDDFTEELGWHELVAQTAAAFRSLPPEDAARVMILTRNYGEAGAIDLFGPSAGLPHAVGMQNTYWLWRPRRAAPSAVVAVGFDRTRLDRWFGECRDAGRLDNRYRAKNIERGMLVAVCHSPRLPMAVVFDEAKIFT